MNGKWGWMAAAALLTGGGTELQAETAKAHLEKAQVRLWYEASGRLSADIAPPNAIVLWNTVIGEGGAEENANDALFTAQVRTDGQQITSQTAVLTVASKTGKILAQRAFRGILTGKQSTAVLPLWVRDIGCAGPVVFSARLGTERQSFSIDFACGE